MKNIFKNTKVSPPPTFTSDVGSLGASKLQDKQTNDCYLKGFTLIETLVAISILLVSITGPMEIASKGLFSAFFARDQITAYYLAQEGLEYVRNGRDTTFIQDVQPGSSNQRDWLTGFEDCLKDDGCGIDTLQPLYIIAGLDVDKNPIAVNDCGIYTGNVCPPLNFSVGPGTYTYDDGNPPEVIVSKFSRTIRIKMGSSNKDALVESTVSWKTGFSLAAPKTFTLRERLFNWQRQ